MKFIRYLLNRQPLASVLIVIVLVSVTTFTFFATIAALIGARALAQTSAMSLTGLLLLLVLVSSGASRAAGIDTRPQDWGRHWWAVSAVMAVLVLTNLLLDQVNVAALVFTASHFIDWLCQAMATGFLEELWFRGACFYLLYRAWGSTRRGVFKAAAVQALLFGLLHMGNLHRSDLSHVLYQCSWATCIGFGFAGLVAYCRSLWPAVVLHALINAAGSVDNFFAGPDYSFPQTSTLTLQLAVLLFFLFAALPGFWCLNRAPLKPISQGCVSDTAVA